MLTFQSPSPSANFELMLPSLAGRVSSRLPHPVRLLLCVEGGNDMQFLRRASRTYHAADPTLPDLGKEELEQRLMFIPRGGSTQHLWIGRLAPLGVPEFHLLDRDLPPATALHFHAADVINAMPQCRARVTSKRELESYLHPDAIREVGGLTVSFTDDDDVSEIVARATFAKSNPTVNWCDVPRRHRKRLKNRVKSWLNRGVVDRMTYPRLIERDPLGDVPSWLAEIATMLT